MRRVRPVFAVIAISFVFNIWPFLLIGSDFFWNENLEIKKKGFEKEITRSNAVK